MNMNFCSYCIALQGSAFSEAAEKITYNLTRNPHQPSCTALIKSASQGCPLCQLIIDSLSRQCRESRHVDDNNKPIYPQGEVAIGGVVGSSGERWIWIGHSPRASGMLRAIEIPRGWKDTWGDPKADIHDASLAMLKEWPRICYRDHPDCARPDESFLPTRLIEVSLAGDEKVRLICTSGVNLQDRRYIALSHCWGLNMPHCAQTFQETLADHEKGITLADLTKTFVDTIIMARKLQVPFVWIDSLCILQNSREDWETEAAQMADVYSNAYITLAASASSDGTQGCRIRSDKQEPFWPYIDIPVIGNREKKSYRVFSWSELGTGTPENDVLQTRGWTLQERELSPRIAHFSEDTVIWECQTSRASLNFPWKDSFGVSGHRRVFDMDSYGRKFPKASQDATVLTEEQKLFVVADWIRLVKLYSRRSLTKQVDVLPAISGVARIFARFGVGEYGAGCFESHGIISLLWVVDTPYTDKEISMASRRPAQYTAPSWSWASIIGPVSWSWYPPHDKLESLVTIKTISTTPSGKDKFGQVKDGFLRVSGKLCILRTELTEHGYGSTGDPAGLTLFGNINGSERKVGWIAFDILDEVCEFVHCIACARVGFPWPQVYGLALLPIHDESSVSTYRRVGRVRAMEKIWLDESSTEIFIV
ncbi:HET-domain-containing protein [Annulohypoxylon maeteangense]|uniref:HET-domain-containing protein n=1 Tax=Annulohypoxylon maeteangense TaxID=1927788 RepID=UPI0020084B94|nr:HET-domain-containing protein [Annulohypoxylon maeteangense]KAI0886749.1 HET-domain-containing protein [Annulohypoxylon maeteangense]